MENEPLRILLLEDNATDAEMIEHLVKKELVSVLFVNAVDKEGYLKELDAFAPDVILADNSLPQFNATEALQILRSRSAHIPFILITGTVSDEFAAAIIKQGADDYILKDRQVRLPSAIEASVRKRLVQKEKEEAFQKLIEGEERYRTFIERVSDGFISLDVDWRCTYVNKKIGEMTGHDPETLIGKVVWDIFPEAIGSGTYNAFHKAMETQQHVTNVDYYAPLDLWQENNIYPSPNGVSVFVRNITKQKKAELALTTAHDRLLFHVENAPLGFIEWDNQLLVRFWSKRAEEIFGWSEKELLEKQDEEGYSTVFIDDRQVFEEGIRQLLQGKLESNSIQIRNYTRGGKLIWCEWYNSVLKDVNGKVANILSLVQDITDRREVEDRLKGSYADIRELASHLQDVREEERAAMAREIHDELGQQLTGFKMDIAWLNRKIAPAADPVIKERLQTSLQLIDRSIRTVRKIATDLRPSILDDQGLVIAIQWQSEEFTKRSGIDVVFENTLPEIAIAPKVSIALFRIYQELLTNIARHANAIIVRSSLYLKNNHLCLKVADNGSGFNVEDIGNKKTLGLLGIKERTLLMQGTYTFKSIPQKGTTVTIAVPLNNITLDA